MTTKAIEATGLRKSLGGRDVLDGVDLDLEPGKVLALLGPNGAGKTTTVRILTTLLSMGEGQATVAGIDVRTDPAEVRRRIGLAGQYAALDERLTPVENLRLIATLRHMGRRRARSEADRLLGLFDLTAHANRQVRHLSGGLRRRVDLAASLLGAPSVLFLDEPTTGLDPVSRNQLWELIRQEVAAGLSILLTTQYLDEADQLADDVAVLDEGHIVAHGSPDDLKRLVGGTKLRVRTGSPRDAAQLAAVVEAAGLHHHMHNLTELHFDVSEGLRDVASVARMAAINGITADDFGLVRPTLDDVFIQLTEQRRAS